jgi:hypothetical protein
LDSVRTLETKTSKAEYEWATIELLDQLARNQSGGEMLKLWSQDLVDGEDFIKKRIGREYDSARNAIKASRHATEVFVNVNSKEVGNFNTLYSRALQAQGKRGILYSPQRYGEYEMLMLDPSFVRPLDYRKVNEYRSRNIDQTMSPENPWTPQRSAYGKMTPGPQKGYAAAQPEFATGATRLSDVFNQMPWVDRINEENKRRIAELIDAQYREQVINQLFGGR